MLEPNSTGRFDKSKRMCLLFWGFMKNGSGLEFFDINRYEKTPLPSRPLGWMWRWKRFWQMHAKHKWQNWIHLCFYQALVHGIYTFSVISVASRKSVMLLSCVCVQFKQQLRLDCENSLVLLPWLDACCYKHLMQHKLNWTHLLLAHALKWHMVHNKIPVH